MTSTVLAQIADELGTNLAPDRELQLIKSAHRIIDKNLNVSVLTDRNDTYHRYVHRLMTITFSSLEKNNADIRLAAEAYYEHILKAYECYGFPETSLKILAMSIERLNGARQITKVIKYLVYYLEVLPKQRTPDRNRRTTHQEIVKMLILKSLDINQTICHQALEKSCDKLISAVTWNILDLEEIVTKAMEKLWSTKGHASRTMSTLIGAIMSKFKQNFAQTFFSHVEKVIETFVGSQIVPVGAISLIRKGLPLYSDGISIEHLKALTEMLLLMVRDSSSEIAYDAFAALEELVGIDLSRLDGFTPADFLKTTYKKEDVEPEVIVETEEFVDPLVNSDLYEQLQETKPEKFVDLSLENFDKITNGVEPSAHHYVAAFLGKTFLLTGCGKLLKTDRQSKDSMKILAIRVLNAICARVSLRNFIVRVGDKTQNIVDIVEYANSTDDQLSQQAIKFAFLNLESETDAEEYLNIFKATKKYRYLLDAVTVGHIDCLQNSQLFKFLELMAFRPLLTTHFDLHLPEITSACEFIGVAKQWIQNKNVKSGTVVDMVDRFQDTLKRCIIDCCESPRFLTILPAILNSDTEKLPAVDDQYPPSIPLQIHRIARKRLNENFRVDRLSANVYDDWRTILIAETLMSSCVRIGALLLETKSSVELSHEKLPHLSRMHWNSESLPSILNLMIASLSETSTKEERYHGFHVGMSILNWIYRNVFIVRGSAETKEFPFLQHSRTEMDDILGNRTEFRATLDAYYKTVQSSADEKLDQIITPTVNLMMASMASNFNTSTENILEVIVYIKILFTLSPISALKLLHILLRSLLDPKLVASLTRGRVFYFESEGNIKNYHSDDDFLVAALKCPGEKYFNHWGDDVDVEKVRMGAMTGEILEQLEPLITQSLKCFRNRGRFEKEQVLHTMICLMNHKLKLSDADPTECLIKYTVTTFAKPEENPDPELFETLMHFLATATRFQKMDESYQKPITAATMLMKSVKKLDPEKLPFVMKAVSFALLNGRYEPNDLEELLQTNFSVWKICIAEAPTETIYALSLLLEKKGSSSRNKELFWKVFSNWTSEKQTNSERVPFSAIALPISLMKDFLTSDEVKVFEMIDNWIDNENIDNIQTKCGLIAALYFSVEETTSDVDWKKYLKFAFKFGSNSTAAHFLSKYAKRLDQPTPIEENDLDEELLDDSHSQLEELVGKYDCGSYHDLCRTIICLGEVEVLNFTDIIEKEYPNDDSLWQILVAEFVRIEDDSEHRQDVTFRLQDLADALVERFSTNIFLKLLSSTNNVALNLSSLNLKQVQFLFDQVTPDCTENGYVLKGIRHLISHSRMTQLIADDELGTAKLFLNLAEKVTGVCVNEALLASYHQYKLDFQIKGDMDEWRIRSIKKLTMSVFALCQETNLRYPKKFNKTQTACFRHPVLNSIFNIPLVAMKCFNWIPVVEILRKPSVSCLPPTGHVCDVLVLDDMRNRLSKVGLVTNAQFEVLFTTMQAVIAHTVTGPEKLDHDAKDMHERESRSCNALQLYIATILTSMRYPNGGDPCSGFVLKSPYISEPFLQSSEFAHLCNLKSVWKCEPRTAFTTPLERHHQKSWTKFDGRTSLYGICQTPLFSLWQLCGMMPIEFKQHANYHKVDHSASNYFITSATNIDTISNLKQLMNIFEYWYSQGIGEIEESLLFAILQTILHLSDFFDDPDLHKAVLRTTSIIYRHEYDQNPFLSAFVHVMFLKSISVLGSEINGPEFKPGEPESITLKLVTLGLANDVKLVRIYTLAGLLYLVQSDSYESYISTIDVLSGYLEAYLRRIANMTGRLESDECQFVIALLIKLLEVPIRLKQDKKTLLKLLLASMRVRRERFLLELIAEGIEQLLCRSNEFNGDVIDFMLVGLESGDPIPFPTDNEYYCRAAYRIFMVAATRAKTVNDEMTIARIYKALQKLGFDSLSRGETASAIVRTLPFFSICVDGVENTITRYMETFIVNGNNRDNRFVTALINQIIETASTSKKWTVELKTIREKLQSKSENLDVHNQWLLNILKSKVLD